MRLLLLAAEDRSDRAALGVLDSLDTMRQAGARFFSSNPSLEQRLEEIRQQDPRYIAHEFLNQDWHTLMFADVADRMAEVKCNYIGSATLAENIDTVSLPPGMISLVAQTRDPVLRETLRDFARAQSFRRDIYRRGTLPVPQAAHLNMIDAVPLEWLGRAVADPISLPTPLGTVTGLPEVYRPLVEMLTARASTIAEMRGHAAFTSRQLPEVLQAVTFLMSGGYVHPVPPSPVQAAARGCSSRLNSAIGAMNGDGYDIGWLASPVVGSALKVDLLETLVVQENATGQSMEIDELTDRLQTRLGRAGRLVQRDGHAVGDAIQARAILRASVATIVEDRLPLLSRLGVL
jgi:hypothetical protein